MQVSSDALILCLVDLKRKHYGAMSGVCRQEFTRQARNLSGAVQLAKQDQVVATRADYPLDILHGLVDWIAD